MEIVPGTTFPLTKTRIFHKLPEITPCSDWGLILCRRVAVVALENSNAAENANANAAENANANADDARAVGAPK